MTEEGNALELWELISKLREDLQAAMAEGEGQAIRFKLETVEIELKVEAKRVGKGKAGIKFWVVEAGAEGSLENDRIQTIKLKMMPVTSETKPDGNREVMLSLGMDRVPG